MQRIRLHSGGLCFTGVIGQARTDVKAALPEAPDNYTGFQINCRLPSGRHDLTIEAELSDGSRHLFFSRTANVRRHWRPLWLGGGDWADLMGRQVSTQMEYPPRKVAPEEFPRLVIRTPRPKLTIATPSFQQIRFLPETLRSVLDQAGVRCDYFVQDGGSTDGSVEIIRQSANQVEAIRTEIPSPLPAIPTKDISASARLISWESVADSGQADAITRAFAKSSGDPDDLMAWINSDDFYLPGSLAFVADFFARHPQVDAIYGHRLLVDESSREIGRWFLPKHDNEVVRLYDFVPQETLFWRRRIWDKVGGLDTSFKFAMDWDLLLRFQAAGAHIVRVPYFLASFRVHPAQKTSAQMQTVGQQEIDALRTRTFGREISPAEIETNPRLRSYLRRSAFVELLWSFGLRV